MSEITTHLTKHEIIPNLHKGRMTGLSTTDVVEIIHNKLTISRQENTPSMLIQIDQSSAFSMIKHPFLLNKISNTLASTQQQYN